MLPASSSSVQPPSGRSVTRGPGDPLLLLGLGVVAVGELGLEHRDRAASTPRRRARGGAASAARAVRGRGARSRWSRRSAIASSVTATRPRAGHQLGDGLVPLLGVHRLLLTRPGRTDLWLCCFSPECVDCQAIPWSWMWPWSPSPPPAAVSRHAARHARSSPDSPTGRSLVVAQEVSPAAIAAYGDGGTRDAEAALAAYDAAAGAVADGFAAKAAAGQRRRRRGADRQRRAGPRQGAPPGRGRPGRGRRRRCSTAVHEGVAQFVDVFTAMGGLMAERATDLLDIERRLVARLVGEPEPGVALPSGGLGARGRRPRAGRHRGARPRR